MKRTRILIDIHGNMEVVDPGFDSLELLTTIDPDFQIQWQELPGFSQPRFLKIRNVGCGVKQDELAEISQERLRDIHRDIIGQLHGEDISSRMSPREASLLDVKIELCRRILSNCRLCAHSCGVNRTHGELGICGLGTEAVVAGHFTHIAEEPPINPSLLVSLYGCGLRCCYCQQWELLDTGKARGVPLDGSLWDNLDTEGARSISFIGGNPDESLYAILRFLASSPPDWNLPLAWNCNAYASPETMQLLDGTVDAYLPDMKYGDERCGRDLSNAPGYFAAAGTAVKTMAAQDVPVIVRILVLPGHYDCCHAPVLDFLSSLGSGNLLVSIRGQYCPDWQITEDDGQMARRPYPEEVEQVHRKALNLGLKLI